MKFILNEDWQVVTDSFQFQLLQKKFNEKKGTKNFGKPKWVVQGYYPTLDLLVKGCLKQEILESDLDNIVDLEAHLTNLTDVFVDAIPHLKVISKRLEVA